MTIGKEIRPVTPSTYYVVMCSCGQTTAVRLVAGKENWVADRPGWKFTPSCPTGWSCGAMGHYQKSFTRID